MKDKRYEWVNPLENPGINQKIWEKVQARVPFVVLWKKILAFKGEEWLTVSVELGLLADMIDNEDIRTFIVAEIEKLPERYRKIGHDEELMSDINDTIGSAQKPPEKTVKEVLEAIVSKLKEE